MRLTLPLLGLFAGRDDVVGGLHQLEEDTLAAVGELCGAMEEREG